MNTYRSLIPALVRNNGTNIFKDLFNIEKNLMGSFMNDYNSDGFFLYESLDKSSVSEDGQSIKLELEMPGYKKEDIKISLKEDMLFISAKMERKGKSKSFTKTHILPKKVDQNSIKASLEDGILSLEIQCLPEKEEDKVKVIEIS